MCQNGQLCSLASMQKDGGNYLPKILVEEATVLLSNTEIPIQEILFGSATSENTCLDLQKCCIT